MAPSGSKPAFTSFCQTEGGCRSSIDRRLRQMDLGSEQSNFYFFTVAAAGFGASSGGPEIGSGFFFPEIFSTT
jgi:hypothetical protein